MKNIVMTVSMVERSGVVHTLCKLPHFTTKRMLDYVFPTNLLLATASDKNYVVISKYGQMKNKTLLRKEILMILINPSSISNKKKKHSMLLVSKF